MAEYLLWEYLDDEAKKLLRSLSPSDWVPPKSIPVRHKLKMEDIEEITRLLKEPGHIERGKDW